LAERGPAGREEISGRREPLLVSACLLGLSTRYDGGDERRDAVIALGARFFLVPVCPEQLGGLPTPRPAAEIISGDGDDVFEDRARVETADAVDVSSAYARGAEESVKLAGILGARQAVLKARSPSCGCREIYDGSFRGVCRPGRGVAAAALARAGVSSWDEDDVAEGRFGL